MLLLLIIVAKRKPRALLENDIHVHYFRVALNIPLPMHFFKIQPKGSTIIFTSKFSFAVQSHLTIFVWQSTAKEISHTFIVCFLVVKIIMLIYAQIQQLT